METKMIQFTPHNYAVGYYIPMPENAGYYTEGDRRANKNGVSDWLVANNKRLIDYRDNRGGVLTNQIMPTQTIFASRVLQAFVHSVPGNLFGLNRIQVIRDGQRQLYFISEDANAIQEKVNNLMDDGSDLLFTLHKHVGTHGTTARNFDINDDLRIRVFMKNLQETFTLPEGLEYEDVWFRDHQSIHYENQIMYHSVFDHDIQVNGREITITITPTEFYTSNPQGGAKEIEGNALFNNGRRTICSIKCKPVQAGNFWIEQGTGGYFSITGELVAQPEPEQPSMKTIVGFRDTEELWYREKSDAVKYVNSGTRKHVVGIDEDGKPVYGSSETTPEGGTTVHAMLATWDVSTIQDVSYKWQKIQGTLDSIPEGYQLSPDAKLEILIIIGLDAQKALDIPKTEIIEPEQPVGGDEPELPEPEPELININTASQTDLRELHGVGPTIAGNIETTRCESPILDKVDMQRVHRIGPKTAENLDGEVTY